MSLIFVDVEAGFDSPCPGVGLTGMTEFGAVEYQTEESFHGIKEVVALWVPTGPLPSHPVEPSYSWYPVFVRFHTWLKGFEGRPIFVSDNPAYDWQWINYWFHICCGENPFGHSARRIGDFYAGLRDDFRETQKWKKLRVTKHDHNPVNDARGNLEAFKRMLKGER